jgi:UDP-N-acetyl-D-mannosaminuronate dehydrogenase
MNNSTPKKQTVGILGYGEIGKAMAKICERAGYNVLIRELDYDQIGNNKIDYLHVNIPEINPKIFIKIISQNIKELKPKLVIINSTTTTGTTRKIFKNTNIPMVHSPVIGVHPHLYESIKSTFPKIIGAIDDISLSLAKKHFKTLGLKVEIYDSAENSETAKLLDLTYFAWNIIFCKWMSKIAEDLNLNFEQIYTKHNKIYNEGYKKLLPNVVRPILTPIKGPIGGHCTIPDVIMFDKFHKTNFTKFILDENKKYSKEASEKLKSSKSQNKKA